MFAILLKCGSADALQFAPAQSWLEDVGGVDRGTCRPGSDEHVYLVYEQDVIAVLQFGDHLLETFLELPPVHSPGNQRADVELKHPLVQQQPGCLAGDDALSQSLDDGRLAHARLTDQRRVVLCPAGQDLDHTFDFLLPPDDGVEFMLFGQSGQIDCQLIYQRGLARFATFLSGEDQLAL